MSCERVAAAPLEASAADMCVVSDAAATKKTLELTKPTLQLRVSMHWRREACGEHGRELHRHRLASFTLFGSIWKHVGHSLAMAQHRRQGKSQNQNQIYSLITDYINLLAVDTQGTKDDSLKQQPQAVAPSLAGIIGGGWGLWGPKGVVGWLAAHARSLRGGHSLCDTL